MTLRIDHFYQGPDICWAVYDPDTVDEVGHLATFASLHEAECFVIEQGEP